MKNRSEALLYFSGYPLTIANEKNQTKEIKRKLFVIKPAIRTALPKTDIANNPKDWDISWFCNYE